MLLSMGTGFTLKLHQKAGIARVYALIAVVGYSVASGIVPDNQFSRIDP